MPSWRRHRLVAPQIDIHTPSEAKPADILSVGGQQKAVNYVWTFCYGKVSHVYLNQLPGDDERRGWITLCVNDDPMPMEYTKIDNNNHFIVRIFLGKY